jgi:hypothetical protein
MHREWNRIQSLWNHREQSFDWAETSSGVQVTNWDYIYPDAAEQAWAVGLGAATPGEGRELMSEVGSDDSLWSDPAATSASAGAPGGVVGYWPGIGWGFEVANEAPEGSRWRGVDRDGRVVDQGLLALHHRGRGQLIVLLAGGPTLPPAVPNAA